MVKIPGCAVFHGGPLHGAERWLEDVTYRYECIIGPPPQSVAEPVPPDATIPYRSARYEMRVGVTKPEGEVFYYDYIGTQGGR